MPRKRGAAPALHVKGDVPQQCQDSFIHLSLNFELFSTQDVRCLAHEFFDKLLFDCLLREIINSMTAGGFRPIHTFSETRITVTYYVLLGIPGRRTIVLRF